MDQQHTAQKRETAPNNLRDFARTLNPDWDWEDWFDWPPDLFALTSQFLKHTGAYRYAADPPLLPWPEKDDWTERVDKAADRWREYLLEREKGKLPALLTRNRRIVRKYWRTISLDRLSSLDGGCKEWDLCRAMLELHAIADSACGGFGHPAGTVKNKNPLLHLLRYFANMLLATTGSLSRLPKHKILVLPKMRTPRVGITLRSLSHYVTAHESEVSVVWRSMPWINADENTVNIMVVPWPYEMNATWFSPEYHSIHRHNKGPHRYFKYSGCDQAFPVTQVVGMVEEARRKVGRIHIVVLPELALTKGELRQFKSELARALPLDYMPMVVSGVRSAEGSGDAEAGASGSPLGRNQVVLTTFFAGKWYDLIQDKHHRWKLDGSQIKQYNFGGVLTGNQEWWEAIKIAPRRMTFLAPNGWLALCPLICEDLARLEPVSELIRGVGPTLAIAILLDGPQIQQRWPARYASVLADDPGTSVLTVSSLGMAERSLSPDRGAEPNRTVALWKDMQKGWEPITLGRDERAVVLTVAADWNEEYTADGRDDHGNAALFVLQGTYKLRQSGQTGIKTKHGSGENILFGKPSDIEELTWFTFLTDAALDVESSFVDILRHWALGEPLTVELSRHLNFKAGQDLWRLITPAVEGSEKERVRVLAFRSVVDWLVHVLKSVKTPLDENNYVPYWGELVSEVAPIFKDIVAGTYREKLEQDSVLRSIVEQHGVSTDTSRVKIYSALAILWAVYKRVTSLRRSGRLGPEGVQLLKQIKRLLGTDYRGSIHDENVPACEAEVAQ